MKTLKRFYQGLLLLSLLLVVSACGSGGDSGSGSTSTTISGSVYAAPVNGATVVVKNAGGTAIAGPVTTAADGTYNIAVPTSALSGGLTFEAIGGTFSDEASGATTSAGRLAAYFDGNALSAGSAVHLDPSSTVLQNLFAGATGTSFSGVKSTFGAAFGFNPDCGTAPKSPDDAVTDDTDAPRRLAALRAAAFSQLAKDLGLTPDQQFALITAIAKDLEDGVLDGKNSTSATIEIVPGTNLPADIASRFIAALATISNTRLTNTYRVEYVPGMAAKKGKSQFQIRVTKRSDGSPATGLTLTLLPMMHMLNGMNHATPVDPVVESATAGTYNCTIYSLMGSGLTAGFWDLRVKLSDGATTEMAMFFPPVGMGMGADTVWATLYGPDDIVSTMSSTQYNKYYLFRDGTVTAASATMNLFITHAEMMNMAFKPVSTGAVMSSPTRTVTSMSVQAATDSGFSSPVTAVPNGSGHWSIAGLPNLVTGQTTTVYIKLNVNGQDKTTNGVNTKAEFAVTPQ